MDTTYSRRGTRGRTRRDLSARACSLSTTSVRSCYSSLWRLVSVLAILQLFRSKCHVRQAQYRRWIKYNSGVARSKAYSFSSLSPSACVISSDQDFHVLHIFSLLFNVAYLLFLWYVLGFYICVLRGSDCSKVISESRNQLRMIELIGISQEGSASNPFCRQVERYMEQLLISAFSGSQVHMPNSSSVPWKVLDGKCQFKFKFKFPYFKSFFEREGCAHLDTSIFHQWHFFIYHLWQTLYNESKRIKLRKTVWHLYIPSVSEITICLNICHDGSTYLDVASFDSLHCYFLLAHGPSASICPSAWFIEHCHAVQLTITHAIMLSIKPA